MVVTLRTILVIPAARLWHIHKMDVYNAFLQRDLLDEIYMNLLQGFKSQRECKQVCRLSNSFYGLKQALRQWKAKLSEALICVGFTQSQYDHSLFIRMTRTGIILVSVYVNDILITYDNLSQILETKAALYKAFKMKYLRD